jgi:hypothetical protein
MLRPMPIEPVPPETARVARAAFPKGHKYLRVADELDALFTDDAFLALFPTYGQPAQPLSFPKIHLHDRGALASIGPFDAKARERREVLGVQRGKDETLNLSEFVEGKSLLHR